MADDKHDKSNRGARDRAAAKRQYGLAYFADNHNLATDDARRVLDATGASREAADARAEGLKQKRPMR